MTAIPTKYRCGCKYTCAAAQVSRLAALPLPLQDEHAILSGSLQHALAHLLHILPADDVLGALQHLRGSVRSTLADLWGLPATLDDTAEAQIFLPRRHRGLDCVAPSTTRCHAAYHSAAALTVEAFADGHARLQVLDPAASAPVLTA